MILHVAKMDFVRGVETHVPHRGGRLIERWIQTLEVSVGISVREVGIDVGPLLTTHQQYMCKSSRGLLIVRC